MAITFSEKRKTQRNLIFVFGAIILITAFVMWKGLFNKSPQTPTQAVAPTIKKIEIAWEVLKNPIFEKLIPIEHIKPLDTKEIKAGRDNPFLPYSNSNSNSTSTR